MVDATRGNIMGYAIDLSVQSVQDITVLNISGDVTALTGSTVEQACNSGIAVDSDYLLMNFDKDCYFNSGGIAFLIDIVVNSRKKGQTVSVTGLSDHFKKIFTMVGLARWVEIHNTVDDAMKSRNVLRPDSSA